MELNKCKLCGCKDINIRKETLCGGQGEWYNDWITRCTGCGCSMELAADNYWNRKWYTKEQAIERWNELHG